MKREFINPFNIGVTYDEFVKAMGAEKIEDYCKGKLTQGQIDFLKTELELIIKK